MLFQDLVDQIKSESRIKEGDDFDSTVISLINELFKEATESQRPFELRQEITLALVAATGIATLPSDFFVYHQVIFQDSDTSREWTLVDQDKAAAPAPRGLYGHPKTFEVMTGGILSIKPKVALVTGDTVFLVYYKSPPTLTEALLTSANPIPRLEPFLIRSVIRRLRMLHSDDISVAQMLSQDVSSAASAYSRDEPEKPTEK